MPPEHHTAIIVGGGPAGLPIAVVLGGWHPYYRAADLFRQRYPQLDGHLRGVKDSLLGLDFQALARSGVPPVDLFRLLHHPGQKFRSLEEIAMEFRRAEPLDYLLISREPVGGLWNNVPQNLLTLSPGQWMEFAFHPLAQYAGEQGLDLDVNALIVKRRLIDYYHGIPGRFEQTDRMRIGENIVRIQPHKRGFLLTSHDVKTENVRQYTCKYLVYAAGQRCILRRLNVPGEDLPFVTNRYDSPADFPGERVVVVGGGRSADWAATELYDAGKQVHYVMRQTSERHWRLIGDSRYGLPYYGRIADILENGDRRFDPRYETRIEHIEPSGLVALNGPDGKTTVDADHVILEIGGVADYSLFDGFPPLRLAEKYDNYRFQVHQMPTHPHNYESLDIPNLYPGGYLAEGIGLVVIAMHGTTYAIAGDILQKEGRI